MELVVEQIVELSLSLGYAFVSNAGGWDFNVSNFLPFQQLRELDLTLNAIERWIPDRGSKKLSSSLRNLVSLNMMACNLTNSMLSELSGFPSLKYLNLESNSLMGSVELHDIEAISKNLEVLDLSYNEITGFHHLQGCRQKQELHKLHEDDNNSCFRGLPSLKELDISNNKFGGVLPLWLQILTNLETLDLSGNQFSGNVGSSPLIHLLSLNYLDLSKNQLQIHDTLRPFANHTKLKYFVGDSNQVVHDISNEEAQPFTQGLHALSLSNCGFHAYPHFLHLQHDLRLIDLSDNILKGNFPTWLLENNPRLHTVILRNTSLFGSLKFPSLTHPFLEVLNLANNKFQGHIPANIGVVFPKLINLDLSNNEFKKNIPSSLSELKSLQVLQLSNNRLSQGINHLSTIWGNLTSLDLSNNDFRGELPSFHGLLKMEFLNLQGNHFSGHLTNTKVGPSPYLKALFLSNNSLEGLIPDDILNVSKFPSLDVLDLSFNKFYGPLPNCTNFIMHLFLNNNRLSGRLTDGICHCFWVTYLDLSHNKFTGNIPVAIGNLTSLNVLLLRGNQFHGEIPVQLCQLLRMIILDFSSNRLYGPIPSCLSEVAFYSPESCTMGMAFATSGYEISVSKLDLNSDKADSTFESFNDKVDFTTKTNTYRYEGNMLLYISGKDLSCNLLTGQIAQELGNLNYVNAVNLSHNKLWGPIPSTFSSLQNTESLDLSYNHHNGSIPTALMTLNTLSVFNVAHNNLSGSIPYDVQFSTFDASSYEGNPLLCGPPLTRRCTTGESPSVISGSVRKDEDEDDELIDMKTFYMTFLMSSVTMFLAVVIIFLINPQWRNALYYLVKACIILCYYFLEDSMRKLRRVRRV